MTTGRELRELRRQQRESTGSPFVFVSERLTIEVTHDRVPTRQCGPVERVAVSEMGRALRRRLSAFEHRRRCGHSKTPACHRSQLPERTERPMP
jgi:hypothetical protein